MTAQPEGVVMPARIQRKRTRGWTAPLDPQGRKPVYVGRGTKWGNPWVVARNNTISGWEVNWAGAEPEPPRGLKRSVPASGQRVAHALAVELYETWLYSQPQRFVDRARQRLAGRSLMCWCAPELPCHADVLLAIASGEEVTR